VAGVTNPPALTMSGAPGLPGGNSPVTFSWPANAVGFALFQTTNLMPPVVWSPVGGTVTVSGTNNTITLNATNDSVYYRLQF